MKKYISIVFLLSIFCFSFGETPFAPCETDPTGEECCNSTTPGPLCPPKIDPNIQSRKDRCPEIASKINENTINFVNEITPGVCCFEGGNTKPKCSSTSLDCVGAGGIMYGRGGLSAGNNKCCPAGGIVYDKDSVTNNYASCCEGKQVYSPTQIFTSTPNLAATEDDNLSCCKYGSVVVPKSNGNNTCISCNTLKQEVESFGTMGPYTQEQESKMAKYKYDCSTTTCDASKQYTDAGGATQCCDGIVENGKCITNNMGTMGIDITQECLINGQCKLDIYETLGIRKSLPKETRSSPGIFIQDIILSATFFVGTLITGVLIISGLLYVFAGANGSLAAKAKKGITGSLIGLVFVVGSYAFVRLIQFLITGGGG